MPRGSAVVRYAGKRGIVWRIKYADADGRQVMETVGRESDGWTRAKACEVLNERIVDVRREGLRRPAEVTVAEFARHGSPPIRRPSGSRSPPRTATRRSSRAT